MERMSFDEMFMKIAKLVSERSTCLKLHVGAVLVKDNHIVATGYNGAPTGKPHCKVCSRKDKGSLEESSSCRGVHAEANCIIQAALHGVSTEGATIYVTHFPCMSCAKMLVNAKIKRIVYINDYDMDNKDKMELLKDIEIKKFEI